MGRNRNFWLYCKQLSYCQKLVRNSIVILVVNLAAFTSACGVVVLYFGDFLRVKINQYIAPRMAVWGKIKITSSGKNTASIQPAPILRFSETLANALGNRKAKYKDVSKDLNKLINKEEEESPIAAKPPFDVERIKLAMQRIIRQQFNLKDEDGDPIKYVYNPAKNLELSQKIAKAIQDRVRSYNYSRYRIVSFCSVVEKENQGISYKMKYAIDPYLDNYAQYVHDMAKFWVIATVLLVYKD